MRPTLIYGDCLEIMAGMPEECVHNIICDPPYHLTTGKKGGTGVASVNLNTPAGRSRITTGFMGQAWDGGDISFRPETWAAAYRVAKPGAHLLAMGGTRTFHRLACAIEDAGWKIVDCCMWVYGSGFPKSTDISKQIDKAAGAEREDKFGGCIPRPQDDPITEDARIWSGYGTALKPAWEPIIIARKARDGTYSQNCLKHHTGALNIDGCRVGSEARVNGRFPANLIHDGSEEVLECFPADRPSCNSPSAAKPQSKFRPNQGNYQPQGPIYPGEHGSAARFFYCAKAAKKERDAGTETGNNHPTVKPVALMRYLVKLVTPPYPSTILDPFMGSGTTGIAALLEGQNFIGIEMEETSFKTAQERIAHWESERE